LDNDSSERRKIFIICKINKEIYYLLGEKVPQKVIQITDLTGI